MSGFTDVGPILVADSSPAERSSLSAILDRLGIPYVTAETGTDAWSKIVQAEKSGRPFRSLIADSRLAGWSTGSFVDELRNARPNLRLVVCSAIGVACSIDHEVQQTHVSVISKPVRRNALVSALRVINLPLRKINLLKVFSTKT